MNSLLSSFSRRSRRIATSSTTKPARMTASALAMSTRSRVARREARDASWLASRGATRRRHSVRVGERQLDNVGVGPAEEPEAVDQVPRAIHHLIDMAASVVEEVGQDAHGQERDVDLDDDEEPLSLLQPARAGEQVGPVAVVLVQGAALADHYLVELEVGQDALAQEALERLLLGRPALEVEAARQEVLLGVEHDHAEQRRRLELVAQGSQVVEVHLLEHVGGGLADLRLDPDHLLAGQLPHRVEDDQALAGRVAVAVVREPDGRDQDRGDQHEDDQSTVHRDEMVAGRGKSAPIAWYCLK